MKTTFRFFKELIESINKLDTYCTDKVFTHVMSKENLLKSQNAKELARNGVPPKYMREFLLKLSYSQDPNKAAELFLYQDDE